jgi:hypothetical protein
VCARACVGIPLSLLGNGSVKIPLLLLANGSEEMLPPETNTHATKEELFEASFSMWPVSYQGKQGMSSSQNFLLFK